jgi:hypothetical protein
MKPDDARAWQNAVLEEVFLAIAEDPELVRYLVFKGARVLVRHVPEAARQSLDLDANVTAEFVAEFPGARERAGQIERRMSVALSRHFERANPVRYELESIRVDPKPPGGHPRGWNALQAQMRVRDLARPGMRGIPSLTIDLAAPERLSEHSTTTLDVGGRKVTAYTLERIAGEKLRAFLSTTPEHQAKKSGVRETLRVKDLPDLARIVEHTPLSERAFWRAAGEEFRLACEGRGVDCAGWSSFEAVESLARGTYAKDATVAATVPFDLAWEALRSIMARCSDDGVVPFNFTLPERTES